MKKFLFVVILFSSIQDAFSYSKYWVLFTNKTGTPYTTTNPSVYLSARSIQRRVNQGIPVIPRDFPPNPSYVSQVLAIPNVTLNYRSRWFNAISITTTDPNAITAINALPFVQSCAPVKRLRGDVREENTAFPIVADNARTQAVLQPQVYNYGQSGGQISQIGGDCLHNLGFHGEGMQIAVLDAGFLNINTIIAFDSLFINNRILGTWDFVSGNSNVFDDDQHGEMVLSCMGGWLDGQIIGTAPKAKYWLLRTEDAPTEYVIEEDNWAAGAEYADSVGADVINTSLGYTTFDDASQNHVYATDMDGNTCMSTRAADFAVAVGMFVTVSAGNSGGGPWNFVGAPADADSVLTVGAVDLSGVLAGFSSRGPSADGRIKPDVSACGNGATVAAQGGGIQNANGTSFSSPITCGAVACLWQAHPTFTNRQVYQAIIQSASQFSTPDNDYGYGIPNFCNANLILSGSDPKNFNADNLISVFPNPFGVEFSFSFYSSKDQIIKIRLTDLQGKLIADDELQVKGNTFNYPRMTQLGTLSSGIYLFNLISGEKVFTKKIVKQ